MSTEVAYWLFLLILAAFGGSVGSFLNVVVYRLPNGLSLVTPPSHCPKCKTPIRWYDNVPVFGWLALGGRCRSCKCHIAVRYPAVEAFTALMFAGLGAIENPLQIAYPYHLTLLCVLLCSALIEFDGDRPPVRLFVFALCVGLGVPLAALAVGLPPSNSPDYAVDLFRVGAIGGKMAFTLSVIDGLIGVAIASLLAGLLSLFCRNLGQGLRLGLLCAGAYLGGQAVFEIALLTAAIMAIVALGRMFLKKLAIPPSMALFAAVLAWLAVWNLFGDYLALARGNH